MWYRFLGTWSNFTSPVRVLLLLHESVCYLYIYIYITRTCGVLVGPLDKLTSNSCSVSSFYKIARCQKVTEKGQLDKWGERMFAAAIDGSFIRVMFRISSVQFSHSVVSNSLWPHGLQHAWLPCPLPAPGANSNSCPLSQWCHWLGRELSKKSDATDSVEVENYPIFKATLTCLQVFSIIIKYRPAA